jgi:hypothetical protein
MAVHALLLKDRPKLLFKAHYRMTNTCKHDGTKADCEDDDRFHLLVTAHITAADLQSFHQLPQELKLNQQTLHYLLFLYDHD